VFLSKRNVDSISQLLSSSLYSGLEVFVNSVENPKNQIKQARRRKEMNEIFLPGEIEYLAREKRLKED